MRQTDEVVEEHVTSPVQMPPPESAKRETAPSVRKQSDQLDEMPWLRCTLTMEVPAVRFTIANLLKLAPGEIVETAWHHTSDVPLRANRTLIGWTEFDVIEDRLAVRITDQA
jgi:flagellar motor switch/type III secretory pathway protein FliN